MEDEEKELTRLSSMASPSTPLAQEPDSPRSSPAPTGLQHELEVELMALAGALYNLGTTVINDSTKDGEKQAGNRVNDVIECLRKVDYQSRNSELRTMVPMQILLDIDNAKNPMNVTRERLERAATENQFMNGKIQAIQSYNETLNEALCQNFPELAEYLQTPQGGLQNTTMTTNINGH